METSIDFLWNLYRLKRNTGETKEQIERLQKKKLEKLLLHAYDHSPYYRRVFEAEGIFRENIRTTPLEKFPVLDKEILMEHFDELVTESGESAQNRDFWILTHRWQNGVRQPGSFVPISL